MRLVANGKRPAIPSEAGLSGLTAAARYVFSLPQDIHVEALATVAPVQLADRLITRDQREAACRFLAVMLFVDGRLDKAKIRLFLQYAEALEVREDYVTQLGEACRDLDWVLQDMTRQNIKSVGMNRGTAPISWRCCSHTAGSRTPTSRHAITRWGNWHPAHSAEPFGRFTNETAMPFPDRNRA
jgi:hypothetical protein